MRRTLFVAVLLASAASAPDARPDTRADDAAAPAPNPANEVTRRLRAVVSIGEQRTVRVGELEDRIAALPPFQRATFGADADAVRRGFLLQVLIPESLFALGAQDQKLDQQLPTAFEVERARAGATIRAIREHIGPEAAIPMADVQAYYDANRDRYDTPERYRISRILCKTQEEAQSVLDEAKKEPNDKEFGDLARDHSIDKASNLRGGNIGFVTADGVSNEPGLKIDPAVVHAAQGVRDGQFVAAPVREGVGFAVVWRRGTIPANKRTVDDVAAQIRDTLWKTRVKTETDKLVADLRAARLKDLNEAALADLPASIGSDAGNVVLRTDAAAR